MPESMDDHDQTAGTQDTERVIQIIGNFSVGCINHHHVVTAGSHTGQDVQRATGNEAGALGSNPSCRKGAARVLVEFNLLIDSGQNSIRRHALEQPETRNTGTRTNLQNCFCAAGCSQKTKGGTNSG